MLNALGLGIVLTMRDHTSMPAGKAQRALLGLDKTAEQFSYRFVESMYRVREGMNLIAMGTITLAAPLGFLKATTETQEELYKVLSLGVENSQLLLEDSLEVSNMFADISRADFMKASYWIKTGIFGLSDQAVSKFAKNAVIVAKATRSTSEEMSKLFAQSYGIFKTMYKEMSDENFIDMLAGGITQTVRLFRTTGHELSLAFNTLNADATQVNYALEEQLALLGILQQTMPGRRAGTRLRALLMGAYGAYAQFGMPIADEQGMLLSMVDLIRNLQKKYGVGEEGFLNLSQLFDLKKAFGSREAASALGLLWNRIDEIEKAIKDIREGMLEGMSLPERMAYEMDRHIGGKLQILAQRAHNLFEIMGEALFKPAGVILDMANNFLLFAQRIAKANPELIRLWAALNSVFGVFLILIGIVKIFEGLMGIIISGVILATKRIGQLFKGLKLLVTVFSPLTLGLIALYISYKKNFGGINDVVQRASTSIERFVKNTVLVFKAMRELVSSMVGLRFGYISEEMKNALEQAGLWEFVVRLFMLYVRIRRFFVQFIDGFQKAAGVVKQIFTPALSTFTTVTKPIIGAIKIIGDVFAYLFSIISGSNVSRLEALGKIMGATVGPIIAFKLALKGIKSIGNIGKFFKDIEKARLARIATVAAKRVKMSAAEKAIRDQIQSLIAHRDDLLTSGMAKSSKSIKMYNKMIADRAKKIGLSEQQIAKLTGQQSKAIQKAATKATAKQSILQRAWLRIMGFPKNLTKWFTTQTKKLAKLNQQIAKKGFSGVLKERWAKPVKGGLFDRIQRMFKWFANIPKRISVFFSNILTRTKKFISNMTKQLNSLRKAFVGLIKQIGILVKSAFAALARSIKGLIVGFGRLIKNAWLLAKSAFLSLVRNAKILATQLYGLAKAALLSAKAFLLANLKFILIAATIIIIIGLVYLLYKNWDKVKEAFLKFVDVFMNTPLMKAIKSIGEGIYKYIIDPIVKAILALLEFFGLIGDGPTYVPGNVSRERPIHERSSRARVVKPPAKKLPIDEPILAPQPQPSPAAVGFRNASGIESVSSKSIPVVNEVHVSIDGREVAKAVANTTIQESSRRTNRVTTRRGGNR